MANWVGWTLGAILIIVAVLTMLSKTKPDDRDWPIG